MNIRGYDIVGDIHGHADELEALLQSIGYQQQGGGYVHASRILIMVDDLIDRGPKQKRVLEVAQSIPLCQDSCHRSAAIRPVKSFPPVCFCPVARCFSSDSIGPLIKHLFPLSQGYHHLSYPAHSGYPYDTSKPTPFLFFPPFSLGVGRRSRVGLWLGWV